MNKLYRDVQTMTGCSDAELPGLMDRLDRSGIDYSECSNRELARAAKAALAEMKEATKP